MVTSSLALLLVVVIVALVALGSWSVAGRLFQVPGRVLRGVRDWNHARKLRKEEIRAAQLQNDILEEKLRNETIGTLFKKDE